MNDVKRRQIGILRIQEFCSRCTKHSCRLSFEEYLRNPGNFIVRLEENDGLLIIRKSDKEIVTEFSVSDINLNSRWCNAIGEK